MEKIIERIKKLLALSGNNSNEYEREVAMQAAQELLEKHNLEMTDIEGHFTGEKPRYLVNSERQNTRGKEATCTSFC